MLEVPQSNEANTNYSVFQRLFFKLGLDQAGRSKEETGQSQGEPRELVLARVEEQRNDGVMLLLFNGFPLAVDRVRYLSLPPPSLRPRFVFVASLVRQAE